MIREEEEEESHEEEEDHEKEEDHEEEEEEDNVLFRDGTNKEKTSCALIY
jgi:hypothetical protein